ncbi:MAG TPA: apolipoprotein N-acyltransferase [Terriglobia bacterium]|nr:apolipoprotein N-acyltransferase [Terriglobia bacterium]
MPNLSNLTLPKKLFLALAAGLLNWAVFPKVGLWPLVWVCQVPLLLASFRETSGCRPLLFGFVAGLVFFIGNCHWIAGVLLNYGGLPWVGAQLLFLLLALYLSSFYALFSWAFARLSLSGGSLCFWLVPAFWVSTEYLRAQVLTGFPWCLLGYGLVDAVNLAQVARWTGVYGLSFAAMGVSAFVTEVLVRPWRSAALRLGSIASVLLCLTLGFSSSGKEYREPTHLVRIVQTNIDLDQKLDAAARASLLDELAQLSIPSEPTESNPQSNSVRLILWPETPAAFYFNHDRDFRRRMENVAASSGAYFLFGFVDFRPHSKGGSERDPYNSVAMLSPDGRTISQYDKIHLVPFGEYIPYEQLFFFVEKISTEAGNFKPGDRVVVAPLDNRGAVGAFVCYEAVVPDLVRRFARDGSQLFVNVTNDAWFGESAAPFQHLVMARMRAIENHRYLLRAANNGISAIISPNGHVVKSVARNKRIFLEGHFAFETQMTLYAQFGDVFAWLCLFTCASMLIWQRLKGPKVHRAEFGMDCRKEG